MASLDDQAVREFLTAGKALAREGQASLVVDEEAPPYSFVKVDGTVTLSDDLEEVRRFATVVGGRHMGEDRAEEFGARNGVRARLRRARRTIDDPLKDRRVVRYG